MKIEIKTKEKAEELKVRVIKAPIVDTRLLKQIIFARTRALVL